ncbi:hypothetical protein ETB97_002788 [Aspergillus alliaceus]|uniref:Uncharacterized protein n=1 Tax=Petromyces alliaceus TaxID=209559 RepID=A0A8H6E4V7_PETAA|nr:hypothetical protein ETB97_002788 [Aspergillus burnettii]
MVPMFSTITGKAIRDPTELDESYFRRNLESLVLFNQAIQSVFEHHPEPHAFLEVGQHSALSGPLQQIFATYRGKNRPVYIPTLMRNSESSARYQLFTMLVVQCGIHKWDYASPGQEAIPAAIEKLSVAVGSSVMRLGSQCRSLASGILSGDATLLQGDKVVLSISKATFFSVDTTGDEPVSITEVRWEPDVELFPAVDMIKRAKDYQACLDVLAFCDTIAILKILEIDSHTRDVDTQIPHLIKWKGWIHAQAHKIREGKNNIFPEHKVMSLGDLLSMYNEFLWGEADPLEALMDSESLSFIYEESIRNVDWSSILSLLSHSNPSLNILEIGAGTGAATGCVLSQLESWGFAMYSKYTFTDISPGFLSAAKEKFRDHDNMEYKLLDINRDPTGQGLSYIATT